MQTFSFSFCLDLSLSYTQASQAFESPPVLISGWHLKVSTIFQYLSVLRNWAAVEGRNMKQQQTQQVSRARSTILSLSLVPENDDGLPS